jgi:hypothetical protein
VLVNLLKGAKRQEAVSHTSSTAWPFREQQPKLLWYLLQEDQQDLSGLDGINGVYCAWFSFNRTSRRKLSVGGSTGA